VYSVRRQLVHLLLCSLTLTEPRYPGDAALSSQVKAESPVWCCIPHPHYHASASPASKSTWRVFLDLVSSTSPLPTDQQRRTRQQHTALEFIPSEPKTQVTDNTHLSHSRSPHSCAHIAQVKVNGRHAPTSRYYFKTIQHTSPFRSTRSQTPKPQNKMRIHSSIGFGIIFSVSSLFLQFPKHTVSRRHTDPV
jgi:hypothetical protein